MSLNNCTCADMFSRIPSTKAEVYRFNNFTWASLDAIVTGRGGGVSPVPFDSLNMSVTVGDGAKNVASNLTMIAEATSLRDIWRPQQVHGDKIVVIDSTAPTGIVEGDAVVTNLRGLYAGVLTADCLPILLADPMRKVVAAIHAGRRSCEKHIAAKTLDVMINRFNCDARRIMVALGPCIRNCCYEVDTKTAKGFAESCGCTEGRYLDIVTASCDQLISGGVLDKQVFDCGICTSCESERFYSHRKDAGKTGRFLSAIAIM